MKKKKLIGFYRNNNAIEAIYHEKNTFYDYNLQETYIAVTVPLGIYSNKTPWNVSSYADSLDNVTRSLLEKNIVWITAKKQESVFYALMYTNYKVRSMSRTGYLLVMHNNELRPVIVTHDNKQYLIEIKGVGSPVGKFPHTHARNQAGCLNKAHVRITGGLSAHDAETEFSNLKIKDHLFINKGISSEVKPLAYTTFDYLEYTFSVLLRLSPSSLRASFMEHPVFDQLMKDRFKKAYYCMGRCLGGLTDKNESWQHQNLSLNNMVFNTKESYDLTDWAEACEQYKNYSAQDYIKCFFPVVYLNRHMPIDHIQAYLKGIVSTVNFKCNKPETFLDTISINKKLLEHIGYEMYVKIKEYGLDVSSIQENINYYKYYFPKDYVKLNTKDWVITQLKPMLELSLTCIDMFTVIEKKLAKNVFQEVIAFRYNEQTKPYLDDMFSQYPDLKRLQKQTDKAITKVKEEFLPSKPLLHEYLFKLETKQDRLKRSKQLKVLLHYLEKWLDNKASMTISSNDFLEFNTIPSPFNLQFVLYPFSFLMQSFMLTQYYYMNGAKQEAKSSEKKEINKILTHYSKVLNELARNPEKFKELFCKKENLFIDLFKWPIQ